MGIIVGAAAGGAVLIIFAIVIYRACHGQSEVSVRKPIEHPLQEEIDSDLTYYSSLKHKYGSPYEGTDDVMMSACSEGN